MEHNQFIGLMAASLFAEPKILGATTDELRSEIDQLEFNIAVKRAKQLWHTVQTEALND